MGAVVTYQRLLRAVLHRTQEHTLARILAMWADHPMHTRRLRADAPGRSMVRKTLEGIDLEIQESFSDPKLTEGIRIVAARVNQKSEIEFRRLVGVSLHSEAGITAKLETFREQNVDLIQNLGADEIERITSVLEEAEIGGWRVEELSKKLLGEFDITKSKADFWAKDQVFKLNGQLTETRQKNAGISEYIWTTSEDERVRDTHAELDGTRQSWDSPPVVSEDGRTEHPGGDYQCRCTAYPIVPALDDTEESE